MSPIWHEADIELRPLFGRCWVESGLRWLVMSISAYDPKQSSGRVRGTIRYGIFGTAALVRLDTSELDHLGPFLGFVGDQLAKVGGRTRKHRTA
jgi:hypothetical protein